MPSRLSYLLFVLAAVPGLAQNLCDREAAIAAYERDVLGTQTTLAELAWTGDVETCDAGQPSALAVDHALTRVNYFRAMTGLAPVTVDATFSAKAQQAALMMHAARRLSHAPDSGYACYTAQGREAAGKSNLYLGSWGAKAVSGYVRDPGDGNQLVGHRRWILYPPLNRIGLGFTDSADAMWVIGGNRARPATPEAVAWPPAGYVPNALVYPRWSYSRHDADFSQARVTMKGPAGENVPLLQNRVANGYGDNTLVWEPARGAVNPYPEQDETYVVTVANVLEGGEANTYQYAVTSIAMTTPTCPDGGSVDATTCACEQTAGGGQATSALADWATRELRVSYARQAGELRVIGVGEPYELSVVNHLGQRVYHARGDTDGVSSVGALPRGVYVAHLRPVASAAAGFTGQFFAE